MNNRATVLSLAILSLTATSGSAFAQTREQSQEVEVYAGQSFGDDLLDNKLSGRSPKLDDHVTFGARYTYNFTKRWGIQVGTGFTPTRVVNLAGGDVDIDLWTLDTDVVFNFTPDLVVGGHRLATYAVAGGGYAQAKLDRPLVGTVGGAPVAIDDDRGFTANAGLGAKFYITDKVFTGIDVRYRYLDKLVSRNDNSLNTADATLSVGYRF